MAVMMLLAAVGGGLCAAPKVARAYEDINPTGIEISSIVVDKNNQRVNNNEDVTVSCMITAPYEINWVSAWFAGAGSKSVSLARVGTSNSWSGSLKNNKQEEIKVKTKKFSFRN